MNADIAIWIISWTWLAVFVWFVLNRFSRKSAKKKLAQHRDAIRARRELRSDKRPTMLEALEDELALLEQFRIRSPNWQFEEDLKTQTITARHILDDDLGRFAEGPIPYELDQVKRDILLAHARRDAAEVLLDVKWLLTEIDSFKAQLREFKRVLVFTFVTISVLWAWVRWGSTLW